MALQVSAQAERYIVQLRSPTQFRALHDATARSLHMRAGARGMLGNEDLSSMPQLLHTNARTVRTFANLRMAVVEGSAADAEALRANADILFVEADRMLALPRPPLPLRNGSRPGVARAMPWGIRSVRAPEAWALGGTGSQGDGARVLVLDTGVDRDHPAIKNRFEEGKNFVVRIAEEGEEGEPTPDALRGIFFQAPAAGGAAAATPPPPYEYFDQNGHGTHTSGTVAGELDIGVAPKARLLMGRVCGKFGCPTSSIISGLNWAITKSVDVVSMSLGGPQNSRSQEAAMVAVDQANIVAVAATGNDGSAVVSFPAASSTAIAVGATDNTNTRASFSQYGPELDIVGPGVDVESAVPQGSGRASLVKVDVGGTVTAVPSMSFVGSPKIASPLTSDLVFAGLGKEPDFAGIVVTGKLALITRGDIPFADKVKNAINHGALGVVIFNNAPGIISGALTQDGSEVSIPVVMIEQSHGERLRDSLAQGHSESTTMQVYGTDYAAFAGTSMATPHVAGVVALVRAANKSLTTLQVRELVKSSATAIQNPGTANEYGAGLVNAEAAVQAAQHP